MVGHQQSHLRPLKQRLTPARYRARLERRERRHEDPRVYAGWVRQCTFGGKDPDDSLINQRRRARREAELQVFGRRLSSFERYVQRARVTRLERRASRERGRVLLEQHATDVLSKATSGVIQRLGAKLMKNFRRTRGGR